MLDKLNRLFDHMWWADRLAHESLKAITVPPETLATYAHILGTEHVWLARLQQKPSEYVVWPQLDLEGCSALSRRNDCDRRVPGG